MACGFPIGAKFGVEGGVLGKLAKDREGEGGRRSRTHDRESKWVSPANVLSLVDEYSIQFSVVQSFEKPGRNNHSRTQEPVGLSNR